MQSVARPVLRVTDGIPRQVRDEVVVEAPLELRLGSTPIAVVMRTPGMDEDLALGFALTEGIVLRPSEIGAVRPVGPDRLELVPAEGVEIDPEQFRRNLYATSSCGVCGKASIDAVRITSPRLPAGPVLSPAMVSSLPDRLRAAQPTFDATGGIHAAGIFDPDGTLLAAAEDVGRHNAVDKAIGRAARLRWPLGEVVLAVSGRASFEVAQKAAVGGIPLIAGVSAASSLAAELADELGMTLVGFTRDAGFVVYAGAARVFPDTPASSFV